MIKHTDALTLDMQICFYTTNLTFCCMMPALIKLECINNVIVIFLLQSYTMRNGVLGVMGEILLKVLSKDSLEDKLKDTRDQFLEKLEVRLTADQSCNSRSVLFILYIVSVDNIKILTTNCAC